MSEVEQQCFWVLLRTSVTKAEAARQIGRSESVVRNIIKDDQCGAKKSSEMVQDAAWSFWD